mmetsp:Transcript_99379/g.310190  ORF Transcript_99379/g.310190 Transcript_99379/m.310190 type:complete len:272 (+) Transcript_99379:3-818(+)
MPLRAAMPPSGGPLATPRQGCIIGNGGCVVLLKIGRGVRPPLVARRRGLEGCAAHGGCGALVHEERQRKLLGPEHVQHLAHEAVQCLLDAPLQKATSRRAEVRLEGRVGAAILRGDVDHSVGAACMDVAGIAAGLEAVVVDLTANGLDELHEAGLAGHGSSTLLGPLRGGGVEDLLHVLRQVVHHQVHLEVAPHVAVRPPELCVVDEPVVPSQLPEDIGVAHAQTGLAAECDLRLLGLVLPRLLARREEVLAGVAEPLRLQPRVARELQEL